MYDKFIYMMLTSIARSALAAGAMYFIKVGVMPSSNQDAFIAAGLAAVNLGWAWWEKVGHAKTQAVLEQVPTVEVVKAEVKVAQGAPAPVKGEGR